MTQLMSGQAEFIVMGGPNGTGKSTCATNLLPRGMEYVNADEIAKKLDGYPSNAADFEAGRIALSIMDDLEAKHTSFAVETTLSSRSLAARATRLQKRGYIFRLIYIWSASAEFSIARVAQRVASGGHFIPENVIRRRYDASLLNLVELYMPLADIWTMHDNTDEFGPRLVAEKTMEGVERIHDFELWSQIRERTAYARRAR